MIVIFSLNYSFLALCGLRVLCDRLIIAPIFRTQQKRCECTFVAPEMCSGLETRLWTAMCCIDATRGVEFLHFSQRLSFKDISRPASKYC